jgi:hypothetical protein
MRGIGAAVVAAGILFTMDQLLNAGRHSEVVVGALIQVGRLSESMRSDQRGRRTARLSDASPLLISLSL